MTGTRALRSGRWLALMPAAALSVVAVDLAIDPLIRRSAPPVPAIFVPPQRLPVSGPAANYQQAIAGIDLDIANALQRATARSDEWLMHEVLARALMVRARLTGSYEDYAAAAAAMDAAFRIAPAGAGPDYAGAVLAFVMHRLAQAEAGVARIQRYAVPPDEGEAADLAAMEGDIAFYRGDYEGALRHYDRADSIVPGAASFRRAVYAFRTGRFDEAKDWFDRTERSLRLPTPQVRANLELQRGIVELERGRWDAALAHFRRANAIFPGHWLIEEHIAEVTTLKGDPDGAERLYRDIVRRTGHPEFMDALAGIATARGDEAEVAEWTNRAAAVWRERLRQFPEAAYDHAIDHCAGVGKWDCALSLAQRNHRARPYGDSKIQLAEALLHTGRPEEAARLIDTVLASPWRTARLHTAAADIRAALGNTAGAEEQRKAALAIDPHALDDGPAQIPDFG